MFCDITKIVVIRWLVITQLLQIALVWLLLVSTNILFQWCRNSHIKTNADKYHLLMAEMVGKKNLWVQNWITRIVNNISLENRRCLIKYLQLGGLIFALI